MLEVRDLRVTVGGTQILHGVDMDAEPGQLVAVVGPNGAGKSTMIRAVAGIQSVAGGSIEWDGHNVRQLKPKKLAKIRAFVPQRPQVPVGVSVREVVELGRAPHLGPLSRPTQADHAAVDSALERTGTTVFSERRLNTLSGGELQRVQIAIALAQDAPALLADEPTSSLDLGAASTIARLLRRLAHEDKLTVVLVVHDLALAAAVADHVVVMSDGRSVAAGPPAEVLTPERLAEVWHVEADIERSESGRTALHVNWLADAPATSNAQQVSKEGT